MKKLIFKGYGNPEIKGEIIGETKPKPKPNEVLVNVKSTSLNPIDLKIAKGDLRMLLPFTKNPSVGFDVSGEIVECGFDVTNYNNGDKIYARLPLHLGGAFSEYITIEEKYIAPMPNISFAEAAALPLVGLSVYQGLEEYIGKTQDRKILIQGASGGVGTFAVQFAKKILGLNVTALTSLKNEPFVKQLGSDNTITYDNTNKRKEKFNNYDIVFHLFDSTKVFKMITLTKKGGTVVSLAGPPTLGFLPNLKVNIFQKLFLGINFFIMSLPVYIFAALKGVKYKRFLTQSNSDQLKDITKMVNKNKIKPVIDSTFDFNNYKEAFNKLKTGRAKGKIILNIT